MASTVPPSRLVRCPKCRNVLPEVTDVPLYQCAVCDTILLAKNFRAQGVSSASSDSVFNFSHTNELDHGWERSSVNSNGESVVLGEEPAHSTGAGNTSNSEDGCHGTGENLKHGGNGNGTENRCEIGDETINCLGGQTAKNLNLEKDESEIGDEAIKCLDGELEKNLNIGKDESETSRSEDKKEDCVESSSQKIVSVENPVDGDFNNGASSSAISPTNTGSPAYEGSVSSFDCRCDGNLPGTQRRLLSRRTFRPRSVPVSPQSDKVPGGGVSQEEVQETGLVSEPLQMTCGLDDMGSFKSGSVGSTSRHGQEASGISEELFHSLENSMELGKDELFSSQQIGRNDSPSSKFRDIEHGRMELLRKVDDLRFQLIGSLDQRSDVDRKSQINGGRRAWRPPRPPLFGKRESEQELLGPPLPALRPKKYPYHCVNCHLVPPQGIFCNKGLCMSCLHMYCPPSNSAGYHSHMVSDPISYHKNPKHDNEVAKLHTKVKDQTMNRHCRPISGGANFIVCSECFCLLQMPDDFHISNTRGNKLRCGSCRHVLTFSFPKRKRGTRVFKGNRGVPYDYEGYGTSSSGSNTTEDEHVLHVSRNSIDSAVELHGSEQLRLHRLMGYWSASEIIYQHSDGEE